MWNDEDRKFMKHALELAGRGFGYTSPNPMVGAVIVRDGKAIAEGWHRKYGGLHAETDALASCREDPSGATMYVTLEPCCHFGKQPPCTSAIIKAGISRVVMAMQDPNPLVSGHGAEILRAAGITVETGLCEDEAVYLNRIFIKYITTRRPWTVIKTAMTLDGRIASCTGDSRWVSCESSRQLVHRMRGQYTGILAGSGTVLADNPLLNCRMEGMKQPVRIIADSRASLPAESAIAGTAGEYGTILAHTGRAEKAALETLRGCGIRTLECASGADGKVCPEDMMEKLGAEGIDSILVEGGAELVWSLVSKDLADEYYIFLAPKIIGGRTAKGPVGGDGIRHMADALPVDIVSVTQCGCDWLIHGFAPGHTALPCRE